MKTNSVLSITGSDSTGGAGIQADIKTITDLGGDALTVISSVTIQDKEGIHKIYDLPTSMVVGQARGIICSHHPQVVKVGLLRDAETIEALSGEIIACRRIVSVPGVVASHGIRLMSDEAIAAFCRQIIPVTTLLVLRCNEAELILHTQISSDADMLSAAQQLVDMGAEWVLLRGGRYSKDRLTALLYGPETKKFFTSYNMEGWQRHGVGGALSAAIATRLAIGDDVPAAISNAHAYIHSQVVYAVSETQQLRPADIYNQYMSLIAAHYQEAHDVAYYASRLCISTRYLSQITSRTVSKTPKQVIDSYIMQQARTLLDTTRLTIQEVAYRLGFSSQAMFSKFFKNQCGRTPSNYRV